MHPMLEKRPIIVVIAGPNGAGKSTFYESFLRDAGLRFLNADVIARELGGEPQKASLEAATIAGALRKELVRQGENFIFETVFSDPVGDKVGFLKNAVTHHGYHVLLCFIGISSPDISETRVAMRVSQGGHDVPSDKLAARYPRIMANLKRAMRELPLVLVFDNDDLGKPYRRVARFENGVMAPLTDQVPEWFQKLL